MKAVLLSTLLLIVGFSGPQPPSAAPELLQQELRSLAARHLRVNLYGGVVEAADPLTGRKWLFATDRFLPRNPTYPELPTLTVDLNIIDTTLYSWRFHYVNSLPLTGDWGFPLQVHDMDGDGRAEAYGYQQTQSDDFTRVYELDASNTWVLRHTYPGVGIVDKTGDIDNNGLMEVYERYRDSLFAYEQPSAYSLPTRRKFRHRQWYQSATGIPNQVYDLTNDGRQEIVYRGSRPDSVSPPNIEKTFVMSYDGAVNNLHEVWSVQLPPDCYEQLCTGSLAVGDFDGDGRGEFATSTFAGSVYVVEHVAGDSFAVSWSTNLSVAGRATAGDVDGNGITEFFVGGTQAEADGYVHLRAYAFERTGDNTFQPIFAFDIFPAGIFFVDLYQTADVDGDGVPELLLSFAGGIMIIRGAGEHAYELFYYRPVSSLDGLSAWRIDGTRAASLFVSRAIGSQPIISQTDVYRLDSSLVVSASEQANLPKTTALYQNYPNPFNPSTSITYSLDKGAAITLTVFDLLGRKLAVLVDGFQEAGMHTVTYEPSSLASGIYYYRLTAGDHVQTRKMILQR